MESPTFACMHTLAKVFVKIQRKKDVTMVDCPRNPCKFNELTQQGQYACKK